MYNIYLFRKKERTRVHAFDWSREHWSLDHCCNLSWVISHISSAIVSTVQVSASTSRKPRGLPMRECWMGKEIGKHEIAVEIPD